YVHVASPKITDAGLKHFLQIPRLGGLSLDAPITDAGLDTLKKHPSLAALHLHRTKVTPKALETLATFPKIQELILDGIPITDGNISQIISWMPRLRSLGLRGTAITDTGLDALKGMKELSLLTVSAPKVTAEGVKKLAAAAPELNIYSDHGS